MLTGQHDKVDELIKQLEDDDLEPEKKAVVFLELADNIAAHSTSSLVSGTLPVNTCAIVNSPEYHAAEK